MVLAAAKPLTLKCWVLPPLLYRHKSSLPPLPPSLPPNQLTPLRSNCAVQLICTEKKINLCGVTAFAQRILLVYQFKKKKIILQLDTVINVTLTHLEQMQALGLWS